MRTQMAVALIACMALASSLRAEGPVPGKPVKGLRLTLTTDKDEIKMKPVELPDGTLKGYSMKPARLTLNFINTGRANLKLIGHDLEGSLVRFEIAGPKEGSVVEKAASDERFAPSPKEMDFPTITPSRSWAAPWRPPFPGRINNVYFRVTEPGEYRIKAIYACDDSKLRLSEFAEGSWTGEVASNVLVVKCVVAGAEADEEPEAPAPAKEGARGADAPAPEAKPAEGALKVILESDRTEVRLKSVTDDKGNTSWEPVQPACLSFSLQNTTNAPLKVFTWGLGMRLIALNVAGPDGQSVRIEKLAKSPLPPAEDADFPTLDAFASWTLEGQAQFPGTFAMQTFRVLKPGEYRLTLTYAVTPEDVKGAPAAAGAWTGTIASAEVVIACVADDKK